MWVSLFLHTPTTCKTQSELCFSELCFFSFCLPLLLEVGAGGMPANTENVVASDGVLSSSKVRALPSLIGSTACLGFCRGWQRWSENSALARHCADQGAAILRAKPADSGYIKYVVVIRIIVMIPVVPHKAVAEVSKTGNLQDRLVVVNQGWQSEATDGLKGAWSLSLFLSLSLTIYLPTYLSIFYVSMYLSISLSLYLSIYLSLSLI